MSAIKKYTGLPYLILILITLLSCDKKDSEENKIVTIGVLIGQTGSAASSGESTNAALAIALQDINRYLGDAGSDYRLEIRIKDTQTDTLVCIQKYNELKNEGVKLIIGPYSSAEVKALKPLADRDGILIISPSSVATSLAVAGDNVFRLAPNDLGQGEAMTALLLDDGIEVIVPVVRDDLWGNELLAATSDQFMHSFKEVVEPVKYTPGTTDFTAVITSLVSNMNTVLSVYSPDKAGVYLISFGEGTDIMRAASSKEPLKAIRWYGSSAYAENKSLIQDEMTSMFAMERQLVCPIFGYDPNARSKWEPLINELQTGLSRKPEIYALVAYDALWLAIFTYLSTGDEPDIMSLKETFTLQANNYYGVTGWTTLNNAGDRALATYDFWGIEWELNTPLWAIKASYNNATKELVRY
jgi:branched-chain amino acid transport system substrate-binding protein